MDKDKLTILGNSQIKYPQRPDQAALEVIENKWCKNNYTVLLECNEFTTLCPVTGQPDFATIEIKYCPDKYLIESKALKLYLFSFRNIGIFHEFAVNKIAHDLNLVLKPHWLEVTGDFKPRGGIAIKPSVRLENKDK